MQNPVIEFVNVVKDYPRSLWGRAGIRAVDGVNLRIGTGEVFGLIGPNRAGKTTLVKLLLSLSQPTEGRIERWGLPGHNRTTLGRVGYVHENPAFPRYLSAVEILEFYAAMSLMPEPLAKARTQQLLERVGLADRAREPIARFSKGMAQRLGLAQALINDPELLVMDEPSEGLDLAGMQLMRDLIREHRKAGRTVLYISHALHEIEQVCDRVGVMVSGKLAFLGTVAQLAAASPGEQPMPFEKAVHRIYQPQPAAGPFAGAA